MRKPYEGPVITDSKPIWVRVAPHTALVSIPRRKYHHPRAGLPTWLVLGPLRPDQRPRATLASGSVELGTDDVLRLKTDEGEVPADLAPALLEACHSLMALPAVQP